MGAKVNTIVINFIGWKSEEEKKNWDGIFFEINVFEYPLKGDNVILTDAFDDSNIIETLIKDFKTDIFTVVGRNFNIKNKKGSYLNITLFPCVL